MRCIVVQKVPYRLTGTNRLVWGVILAQYGATCLLFVQATDDKKSSLLVFAEEDTRDNVYEQVRSAEFPVDRGAVQLLSMRMDAMHDVLCESEYENFFARKKEWE
jgi:hypothetical protein